MKKLLIIAFTLSLLTITYGQSNDSSMRVSDRYMRSSTSTYHDDLAEYEKMALNETMEPSTLYNYYFSVLHANYFNKNSSAVKSKLDGVYQQLSSIDPHCFETKFIYYFQNKGTTTGFESLQEAYALEPDNTDVLDDMMAYFEIQGDRNKVKGIALKIKNSGKYSQEIYDYQRNVIASTKDNTVIFTNGELDTYPLLILLLTEKHSRSIKVINFNLLKYSSYKSRMLGEIGCSTDLEYTNIAAFMESLEQKHLNYALYVSLTNRKQTLKSIQNKLFLTGLVFQYSASKIDNVKICYDHFKEDFEMQYLWNKKRLSAEVSDLNQNYLPMLNLIQSYAESLSNKQKKEIQLYINHVKK